MSHWDHFSDGGFDLLLVSWVVKSSLTIISPPRNSVHLSSVAASFQQIQLVIVRKEEAVCGLAWGCSSWTLWTSCNQSTIRPSSSDHNASQLRERERETSKDSTVLSNDACLVSGDEQQIQNHSGGKWPLTLKLKAVQQHYNTSRPGHRLIRM